MREMRGKGRGIDHPGAFNHARPGLYGSPAIHSVNGPSITALTHVSGIRTRGLGDVEDLSAQALGKRRECQDNPASSWEPSER